MKKVELLNLKGEKVKDINLNEEIFGITPNKAVLNLKMFAGFEERTKFIIFVSVFNGFGVFFFEEVNL